MKSKNSIDSILTPKASAEMTGLDDVSDIVLRLLRTLSAFDFLTTRWVESATAGKTMIRRKALQILASNDIRDLKCVVKQNGDITASGLVHSEYKRKWYLAFVTIHSDGRTYSHICVCKQRYVSLKFRSVGGFPASDPKLRASNFLRSPKLCIHIASILYALVAYRGHALDAERPKWLKLRGTRFISRETLRQAGIRSNWNEYLNVMVTHRGVVDEDVIREKPMPKKRGRKPQN